MKPKLHTISALVAAAFLSSPALAGVECGLTTFQTLNYSACYGAFEGNIYGSPSETAYLASKFGGTVFTYLGKTDDPGNGPFTGNPETNTGGVLTFDAPITGSFVIGLKASDQYSYYLFNAVEPVSSLTFSSTSGVAMNKKGFPQDLSHANLYTSAAPVPEPETYALMLAGLGALGFMSRRRKAA
jgi:hypothetical protein